MVKMKVNYVVNYSPVLDGSCSEWVSKYLCKLILIGLPVVEFKVPPARQIIIIFKQGAGKKTIEFSSLSSSFWLLFVFFFLGSFGLFSLHILVIYFPTGFCFSFLNFFECCDEYVSAWFSWLTNFSGALHPNSS